MGPRRAHRGPVGIRMGPYVKYGHPWLGSSPTPSPLGPPAPLKKVENLKTSFRQKHRKNGNPKNLPERPKPIRIIRRLKYGSIPAHTATYGSLTGPISHLIILKVFPFFVRGTFRFFEIQPTPPKSSQEAPNTSVPSYAYNTDPSRSIRAHIDPGLPIKHL